MHIPDGILSVPAAGITTMLSLSGVWAALRRVRAGLPRRIVPLMGVVAAFVFAGQMINFPVGAGTSGHLLGGVLAAVLVGPSAAMVVMTAVLVVQCLLFADGGLLALGANVLNMACVAVWAGFAVYASMRRVLTGSRGLLVASAFAAWCSIVAASVACAAQLVWSGLVAWHVVFPAMAGVHMLIGLGEAVITTLVLAAILRTRPDLIPAGPTPTPSSPTRVLVAYGLALSVGLILFGVPVASALPDGFEHVATQLGIASTTTVPPVVSSPMTDYVVPGLSSAIVTTSVAGIVGAVVTFTLALGLASLLVPKSIDVPTTRHAPPS